LTTRGTGQRRFLIELPTGTGKTDVICLHGAMFKAGRAERLLFLVDREQLGRASIAALQTLPGIQQLLA